MATRRARDGNFYTEVEFQQWYGTKEWERAGAQEPGTAGLVPEAQQATGAQEPGMSGSHVEKKRWATTQHTAQGTHTLTQLTWTSPVVEDIWTKVAPPPEQCIMSKGDGGDAWGPKKRKSNDDHDTVPQKKPSDSESEQGGEPLG